jgi:hypothetical protein
MVWSPMKKLWCLKKIPRPCVEPARDGTFGAFFFMPRMKKRAHRGIIIDFNTLDNLKPPLQHINSCSSLHRRNGARTLGGKPSLII